MHGDLEDEVLCLYGIRITIHYDDGIEGDDDLPHAEQVLYMWLMRQVKAPPGPLGVDLLQFAEWPGVFVESVHPTCPSLGSRFYWVIQSLKSTEPT